MPLGPKPKRIVRTPEQMARTAARRPIENRFFYGWMKDMVRSKIVGPYVSRGGDPQVRMSNFTRGTQKMLPQVRALYERKERLFNKYLDGKISIEEIKRHPGLFSNREISELASFREKVKTRANDIRTQRALRKSRARQHARFLRKSGIAARKNMNICLKIGERVLEGKIRTKDQMIEEFRKKGISWNGLWDNQRYWIIDFDNLLGDRKNRLESELQELRKKIGRKKLDQITLRQYG